MGSSHRASNQLSWASRRVGGCVLEAATASCWVGAFRACSRVGGMSALTSKASSPVLRCERCSEACWYPEHADGKTWSFPTAHSVCTWCDHGVACVLLVRSMQVMMQAVADEQPRGLWQSDQPCVNAMTQTTVRHHSSQVYGLPPLAQHAAVLRAPTCLHDLNMRRLVCRVQWCLAGTVAAP